MFFAGSEDRSARSLIAADAFAFPAASSLYILPATSTPNAVVALVASQLLALEAIADGLPAALPLLLVWLLALLVVWLPAAPGLELVSLLDWLVVVLEGDALVDEEYGEEALLDADADGLPLLHVASTSLPE
jgi:hypothetical protein